jgi:Cu-Zn family superoxide dismutase
MYRGDFQSAAAVIRGGMDAPNLAGNVWFTQTAQGVRVDAQLSGLPPNASGFYGFHVHTMGDCSGQDFSNAMGHYNPSGTRHPLHAGDLPPLIATDTGDAWLSFVTTRFTVRDITGRSVIIHADRDDLTSQPAGNSGKRIGCGVIRGM